MAYVIPLTRTLRGWSARVRVDPPEGGVTAPSELMCDQMRAVSEERLERPIGSVNLSTMQRVAVILRLILVI